MQESGGAPLKNGVLSSGKKIKFFPLDKFYKSKEFFENFFGKQTELLIKFFPLARGERPTFFCCPLLDFGQEVKKKVPKKKLATLQVDRLSALCFEAMKTLRKSLRFGAELFACRIRWRDSDVFLFCVRLSAKTVTL